MGEQGTEKLLILSQVILSLQLSFAVVPLVMFTGDRREDGRVCEWPLAAGAGVVSRPRSSPVLNVWLLVETAWAAEASPFPPRRLKMRIRRTTRHSSFFFLVNHS
jgi:Mn2+/Fe2+ NRAMP family transporter